MGINGVAADHLMPNQSKKMLKIAELHEIPI
jgi:hypothetical protein